MRIFLYVSSRIQHKTLRTYGDVTARPADIALHKCWRIEDGGLKQNNSSRWQKRRAAEFRHHGNKAFGSRVKHVNTCRYGTCPRSTRVAPIREILIAGEHDKIGSQPQVNRCGGETTSTTRSLMPSVGMQSRVVRTTVSRRLMFGWSSPGTGRKSPLRGEIQRFRRRESGSMHWLGRIARRNPTLFVLWQLGVKPEAGS
jgi:hypothetical protein